MAKKGILPGPQTPQGTGPAESPWIQKEIPAAGYPGSAPPYATTATIPAQTPYPGSGVPGEPWSPPASPTPRRLRRDA